MKKILILTTVLTLSATALAFGGGGSGRKSTAFTSGVDAIGVHINEKGQAEIITCNADEEWVDETCLKRCTEGFERNTDDTCTICANENVYLSYNKGNECGTEVEDFTGCKSNKDCATLGENYFCNLKNETDYSCYYPTSGTCEPITTSDYTDANVEGLGDVRRSTSTMTWWAAENWCKAQKHLDGTPMHLIDVSKFECYQSGTTTLVIAEAKLSYTGGCCAERQTCSGNFSWYTDTNKSKYSSTLKALESAFGHKLDFWTASVYIFNTSCSVYYMNMARGNVGYHRHDNEKSALCE